MPTVEKVSRTDSGLASELRLAIMRLRRRLAQERHPDNELSINMMAVLGQLYRGGELTLGDLARGERVQPPSMTRTVTRLEAEGLVTRRPHDTDGRQTYVAITDGGRAVALADRDRRDAWMARQLTQLSAEDREVLRRATPILERLAKGD